MDPLLIYVLLMVWLSGVLFGVAFFAVVSRRVRRRHLLRDLAKIIRPRHPEGRQGRIMPTN